MFRAYQSMTFAKTLSNMFDGAQHPFHQGQAVKAMQVEHQYERAASMDQDAGGLCSDQRRRRRIRSSRAVRMDTFAGAPSAPRAGWF